MDIKIIYEDDDIIAVNKPAGIIVHGVVDSLVDWLIKKYQGIKNVGEDKSRPGIVHRLDKDTSGVLLIAKNQKTFEYLKEQFQKRKIKKKYIALVWGKLKGEKGIIDLPIGKSKSDFRKKSTRKAIGKIREAITEYKTLQVVKSSAFDNYTLVEVYPKTGRTHQIRVHFKAIGHPIVCDKLYGPKKQECPFGLSRHFLHASSLELTLPNGARIKLEADLPEDLSRIITK
jgi:23S rRNA pseudouridine1911/1915/1917 synthase